MLESTQDNVSELRYWQSSVTLTFNLLTPKCIGIFLLPSTSMYKYEMCMLKLLKLSFQQFHVFYTHKYLTYQRLCYHHSKRWFHDFKVTNNKFNVNVSHGKAPVAVLEYKWMEVSTPKKERNCIMRESCKSMAFQHNLAKY